jgi:hypothetical protein
MFEIAQSLRAIEKADPFNAPWVSAWRAISWYLRRLPYADRGPLMLNALRQTGALSVTAILIHLNSTAEQRSGDRREPWVDEANVQALKAEWLVQIGSLAADQDRLLAQPDLISLLYNWRGYSGSIDAPQKWVSDVVQTDQGFAKFVMRLMISGTTHSVGDRVASRFDSFDSKTLDDFIGIGEAQRRADAIDKTQIPSDQAYAVKLLCTHIAEWAEKKPMSAWTDS